MNHDYPGDISDGPCGKCENDKVYKASEQDLIRVMVFLLKECKSFLPEKALFAQECDGGQTLKEAIDEVIFEANNNE